MTDENRDWEDVFIYVLQQGRRRGPFTVDAILDGLEQGDFSPEDICLREGAADCERLRDLLDEISPVDEDLAEGEEQDQIDFEAGEDDWETHEEGFDYEEDFDEDESPALTPSSPSSHRLSEEKNEHRRRAANRLIYAGHPSIVAYPISLLALVVGFVGGIWAYRINPNLMLFGFSLGLVGLIRISLVRYTNDYRVRARRIERITGLLARSSQEIRVSDIRSINVTCRGLIGIMGIGTVDFLTSGDQPEISFEKISGARKVKAAIRRLQDESE